MIGNRSRRAFLAEGLAAGVATGIATGVAAGGVPGMAMAETGPLLTSAPGRAGPTRIGIASRHLQWTSMEEAVSVAAELGFGAIEWSVRPGAHVQPDAVARDLPRAVELTRRAGLAVEMISANILDATDPFAEAIIGTAAQSGVRLCRGAAPYRWASTGDRMAQLDAVRRKLASVVALNERHGATLAFHTYSGAGMIGGNLWDLWTVLRGFDPGHVGFNYDIGHGLVRNGNGWRDALIVAAPYIHASSVKDFLWHKGPRGWGPEWVPVGEGMVDLPATMAVLAEIGAKGPVNLQVEHHGLLGSDVGKAGLTMQRAEFMAIVKQDLDAVRRALSEAQSQAPARADAQAGVRNPPPR